MADGKEKIIALTDKEKALIDKRRETSKLNAEKARNRRMEKKQKLLELEQIQYETKREDFNQKLQSVVKPKTKPLDPIEEEDDESEDEEEFIIRYNNGKKKFDKEPNEQVLKKIDELQQQIEEMRKAKQELKQEQKEQERAKEELVINPVNPIAQPHPSQPQQTKVIVVKAPNVELTNHMRQKILNF